MIRVIAGTIAYNINQLASLHEMSSKMCKVEDISFRLVALYSHAAIRIKNIQNNNVYPIQSQWHSLKPYLMFAYSDIDVGVLEFYGCQIIMADEPMEATDKFNDNISIWAEDNGFGHDDYEVTQTQALELVPLARPTCSKAINDLIECHIDLWRKGCEINIVKCGACWHELPAGLTFRETQNWQVAKKQADDAHAELMRQQPDA
jgi:hypothetical protein